jgi:hypothetical protein
MKYGPYATSLYSSWSSTREPEDKRHAPCLEAQALMRNCTFLFTCACRSQKHTCSKGDDR